MPSLKLRTTQPFRLRLSTAGVHRFGGPPAHRGVTPAGTDTPMHLMALLDLADANCPFESTEGVRYLPLYYPLKHGYGGPTVQYAVRSDDEIEILHVSPPEPDPPEFQYVQVDALPSSPAEIVPLSYEEARALSFAGGHFQPNADDSALLDALNHEHDLILIGGGGRLPVNAGEMICRNARCEFFNRRVWVDVIASIPPIPVEGDDEFWHEYQGEHMAFYFVLCNYCGTVIGFNVSS